MAIRRAAFHSIDQDFRQALRGLATAPGFTATIVLSLGIGVAATAGAFAFITGTLFPALPGVTDQQRLVAINFERKCGSHRCGLGPSTFDEYGLLREALPRLDGLSAATSMSFAVGARGHVLSLNGALVSANYFDVLGVRFSAGRGFNAGEEQPADAAVAVISRGLWRRLVADGAPALGDFVSVGGHQVRIVGVAPERFGRGTDLWLPFGMAERVGIPQEGDAATATRPDRYYLSYVGRLPAGVSIDDIDAQAQVAASRMAAARPDKPTGVYAALRRFGFDDLSGIAGEVAMVMLVPVCVLIIACINAANLLLARGSQRLRETAVRLALGATRWRIVRQLLVESVMLALLAAALTLPLLAWALGGIERLVPVPIDIGVDARVVLFTLAMSLASVLAFGLAPALRMSAAAPAPALGSSRTGETPRRSRVRQGLVAAQVALSLGLLATGSQLITAVKHLAGVTGAKDPETLLMVSFDLSPFKTPPAVANDFYDRLLDDVRRLPGVERAGLARGAALWTFGRGVGTSPVIVWMPDAAPKDARVVLGGFAGGDLFEAVGLRLLQGRMFTPQDRTGSPRVAIVSRTAADRYLHGAAIGRIIRIAAAGQRYDASEEVQIVGVIEPTLDPNYVRTRDAAQSTIYLPARFQPEPALTFYVRAREAPAALIPAIREAIDRIDPRVPFTSTSTLAERRYERQTEERLAAQGVGLLGLLALGLASGGLFGVVSFLVSTRRREIGVRMALGAEPRGILTLVLKQGMTMALVGGAVGGGIALVLSAVLRANMPGLNARLDVGAFAATACLLVAVLLLASLVPARRAARVDPMVVLRED